MRGEGARHKVYESVRPTRARTKLRMSMEGPCLDTHSMIHLPKVIEKHWVRTPMGDVERKFVRAVVGATEYLVDKVTASLYEPATGRCISTEQLFIIGRAE